METKANFTLIGAIATMALFLTAIFAVWLGNYGFKERTSTYDVVFEGPVRGLEPGGDVRFNGIKVGEVSALRLSDTNPNAVVARIKVTATTPVKADSVAQLEPAGLTGLAYVQIMAGSDASPLLRQRIGYGPPVIRSRRGQLDRLFSGGEGVIETTLQTLSRLNHLLNDENMRAISTSLANLEHATGKIAGPEGLVDEASLAAAAISQAGIDVSALSRELAAVAGPEGSYGQLGQQLLTSSQQLSEQTSSLLTASQDLVVSTRKDMDALSANGTQLMATSNEAMTAATGSVRQIGAAAQSLTATSDAFRGTAQGVTAATQSLNAFFTVGTNQTLPDISRATRDVSAAANRYESLATDVQNNPSGVLAPAPAPSVRWPH